MNVLTVRSRRFLLVALMLGCMYFVGCSYRASAQYGHAADGNLWLQAEGYPRDQHGRGGLVFNRLSIHVTEDHPFMLKMPDGAIFLASELTESVLRQKYPRLEINNPARDGLSYRSEFDRRSYISFEFDKTHKVRVISIRACRSPWVRVLGDASGNGWYDMPMSLDSLTRLFGEPDVAGPVSGVQIGEPECPP